MIDEAVHPVGYYHFSQVLPCHPALSLEYYKYGKSGKLLKFAQF